MLVSASHFLAVHASRGYPASHFLKDHSLNMATFKTDVNFGESRGTEVNVIMWVFTGIMIVIVVLKLFAHLPTTVTGLG